MNVESKEYCMMISSHDIPHTVLQACAVACGIVLANYYPSELMPVAIKDNDSFLGRSWSVAHRVNLWQTKGRLSDNARTKK